MIRVVARASLSPKHSAALIHVGRRFVLVGMSAERVQTLCEIGSPEEVAELALRLDGGIERHAAGFEQLLSEEAADYRRNYADGAEAAGSRAAESGRGRKPLSELLHRLRALQSAP